ncbi:MAG: hypothetical protein PVG39_21445 [Desulfobacteraceae bacterium]|jgi:hypothetical protein
MSLKKDNDVDESRRSLLKGVSAGAAGAAIASALATLGAPMVAGAAEEKKAESSFFKDLPPWPKGTDGHIYDHLFCTQFKEKSLAPEFVPSPCAYFRGDAHLPGAKMNMGWQQFVKGYKLEVMSHHHDVDEYLIFLGCEFPDLIGSFDAEIEIFIGKEYERHIVNKATVLYIPAGVEHNPCDIRKVNKPFMFSALHLSPYFNHINQKGGYMEFRKGFAAD